MNGIESGNPFELLAERYDHWFDNHHDLYDLQRNLISPFFVNEPGLTLEIGCGSGRFTHPFGIAYGLEPSLALVRMAHNRGVETVQGQGEFLPFQSNIFSKVLMVTVMGFASDPVVILQEIHRILIPLGSLIIVEIDYETETGITYRKQKKKSPFFSHVRFFTEKDVREFLVKTGFQISAIQHGADLVLICGEKES